MRITIDGIENLERTLKKLKYLGRIAGQWMNSGEPDRIMQRSFLENFRLQGRPRWLPLSRETILDREYRDYDDGPILQRSGQLMDKVTSLKGATNISDNWSQIVWGIKGLPSDVRKKFGPNQIGKGRNGQHLPARPMIGFQKKDGKVLVTSLANWIAKSIK